MKTHILKRGKEKTYCSQSLKVMTDYSDSLIVWVKKNFRSVSERAVRDYLKRNGYCAHCFKKFLLEYKDVWENE